MQMCGLNSLMVCFNVKTCVIYGSGNVITRSEIFIQNIRSLGFRDIREGVTLRRLILGSLECIDVHVDLNLDLANELSSPRQLTWGSMTSPHELFQHDLSLEDVKFPPQTLHGRNIQVGPTAWQEYEDFLDLTKYFCPPAQLQKNHCPCILEGHLSTNPY